MFGKFGMLGAVAVAAVAADAATITKQIVRQQWPWQEKVRIDYVLDAAAGEQSDVVLKVTDPATDRDVTGLSTAQSGDLEYVTAGEHVLYWTPDKAEFADGKIPPMLKFELSAKAPIGKKYLVIEFSHGDAYEADRKYTVTYEDELDVAGNISTFRTTKMAFRRCRAGTYLMGSPETEEGRNPGRPNLPETLHRVTLTKDFYLAVMPMVAAHAWYFWEKAGGDCYYTWQNFFATSKIGPVRRGDSSNWSADSTVDADSYIGKARVHLNAGDLPSGYVLDLPTEAQWEYACRAGTVSPWNDGSSTDYYDTYGQGAYSKPAGEVAAVNGSDHNLDKLGQYMGNDGLWRQNIPANQKYPGGYAPNAWGFYDMHGGVNELCLDFFHDSASGNVDLGSEPQTDPRCTTRTGYQICRGGEAFALANACRSAARCYKALVNTMNNVAFRLAIVPEVSSGE